MNLASLSGRVAASPVRLALGLAWATVLYNVVEGLVAIGFGITEESIALLGFGADSWVEVASAAVVLWRLRGENGRGQLMDSGRERTATRIIGWLLVGLAVFVAAGAGVQLASGAHPETTLPGLIISGLSLSFMVFLWRTKLYTADVLGSCTLRADAACSRSCIELSIVLFVGSVLFLLVPALWWADAVAALALALLIGREGRQSIVAASKPDFAGGCGCGG